MVTGRALVVGAGVSGLTTAIGLCARGWDVDLEDSGHQIDNRGAALGIWPRAWRGLEELGVTAHLTDAYDYTNASIRTPGGKLLGYLPLQTIAQQHGAPVRLVTRPALMEALSQRFHECRGRDIVFGSTFTGDRDVSAYDLVVGADGINSRVRPLIAPGVTPRALGATAWRGSCEGLAGPWGEVWGGGVFAGVTPAGHARTNWYIAIADSHQVTSFDDVRELIRTWPADVVRAVDQTPRDTILRHPLNEVPPLLTYVDGPFVLVGDAAHAMAPSLGQGACQAIVDAVTLTRAIGSRRTIGIALDSYDRTQRREGSRLVKRSRLLLRLQLSPVMAPARDLILRLSLPFAPR